MGLLLSEWVSNMADSLSARHKSCFFWAAHRSAAQHASERRGRITLCSFPRALSLRTCRPAFFLFDLFSVHALSRLSRQSSPAQGYVKGFGREPFKSALHPVNPGASSAPHLFAGAASDENNNFPEDRSSVLQGATTAPAHKHASRSSIKANKLNSTASASSAEDGRMATYNVQPSGMPARTCEPGCR